MSENKFKVGDRVRCIDDERGAKEHISKGSLYTVEHCSALYVRLEGLTYSYFVDRFELAPVPKEFRIRNAPGGISFAKFSSAEDAQEAARRDFLDGDEFEIVEVLPVAKYRVEKILNAA